MRKTLVALFICLLPAFAFAKIQLPKVLGDNMVLQQHAEVKLWGKSDSKKDIVIKTSWDDKTYKTKADGAGNWMVQVQTIEAGGPYTISFDDGDKLVLNDILLGEVWVCSGQSNMEFTIRGFIHQYTDGILGTLKQSVHYPNVRLFTVEKHSVATPQDDCKDGEWKQSSYENVLHFSAVAYYFGRMLNEALDVPVGVITTNWGGSRIETWMTEKSIQETPGINHQLAMSWEGDNSKPAALYNGMIHPIINYAAKGFIWYQGESNRDNYYDYKELMKSMINLWRAEWGDNEMPFYYVQLAPYNYDGPELRSLALTIEAQAQVLNELPHTGMASTTDIGHPTNIHPPKKQEVGERLAFLALANDYGVKGLPAASPMYESMEVKENKALLSFANMSHSASSFAIFSEEGVYPVLGFEIAGADQVFYPAKAQFVWGSNKIEVFADEVKTPVAVRYAFRNYPEANVQTTYGLPLVPFRTDSWEIPANEVFK